MVPFSVFEAYQDRVIHPLAVPLAVVKVARKGIEY